jgi:hypothetical protein
VKRRVLAIMIVLAAVACGSDGEVDNEPVRFATPAELTGPWRTTPLILDPALRARVAEACRRGIELPAEAVPAVIDARGGRVVTVRMTGATEGSCDALEIGESADVVETGGGWNGPAQRLPAAPDTELSHLVRAIIARRNLPVEGWSVNGQAGAAIALVQVVVGDGLVVTATLRTAGSAPGGRRASRTSSNSLRSPRSSSGRSTGPAPCSTRRLRMKLASHETSSADYRYR